MVQRIDNRFLVNKDVQFMHWNQSKQTDPPSIFSDMPSSGGSGSSGSLGRLSSSMSGLKYFQTS